MAIGVNAPGGRHGPNPSSAGRPTSRGRYQFRSTWDLAAPRDVVFAALCDVESYPEWWPQVRSATPLRSRGGRVSGELRCRSLLPYDLVFVARQSVVDPVAGVLRADLSGDLIGSSEWRLTELDGGSGGVPGTRATFVEDVEVGNTLIRRLGFIARPLLRANHDLMMRSGETGLRRYLG